ncbi:laccase subfamily 2 [Mycena floridula]|nr:laccase subfamily 2 [Mycena floridula]KAJ7577265.1 laccase subfamily 2 [Mycena floridula]
MLKKSIFFSCLAIVAKAAVVNVELFIGNKVISPDGFAISTVLAGLTPDTLQYPGPLITAKKGDIINVKVNNQLTDPNMRRSTSLFFSGIHNKGHSEFYGASFVTQCPIAPNSSFTYTLDTADQSGSYLYRSGLSAQYSDGLRGPLIIYDPKDPHAALYQIDDASTIIQLGEWYEDHSPSIISRFINGATIPIYDAGLINGVGRTVANPNVPFPVFSVTPGVSYRFRLISNAPRAVMPFSIDGHNFTVIEADGIAVVPVTDVQRLLLYPGQRYSVVFTANQPIGNYWLRSYPTGGNLAHNPNVDPTLSKAILRYVGAPVTDPTTPDVTTTTPTMTESQLIPLINPGPPGGPDATPDFSLVLNFTTPVTAPDNWGVNGISYVSPSIPTLSQILQNNDSFPETSHVVTLPSNALVDLIMPLGEDGGGHPIHIQGVTFDVIQPGDTNVTNLINPSRRDIIPIIGDTTIVRFKTPGVGVFHLHCHIIWHAEVGLQLTFISPPDEIRHTIHPSPKWQQLCDTYNALPDELK